MSNNSSILSGKLDSLTGISGVCAPSYTSIGIGHNPYTIGDMPSFNGDPGLNYDKKYHVGDYNRSWEYHTYTDHVEDIDPDIMKKIQEYIHKSNQTPAVSPQPVMNPVTKDERPVRKRMAKSKDVGDGLAEMINDLV